VKVRLLDDGRYWIRCPGCTEPHVLDDRWAFNGDVEQPTFSPSLLIRRDHADPRLNVCHSFITDGRIMFLADSTHALAKQTVPLPDVETTEPT